MDDVKENHMTTVTKTIAIRSVFTHLLQLLSTANGVQSMDFFFNGTAAKHKLMNSNWIKHYKALNGDEAKWLMIGSSIVHPGFWLQDADDATWIVQSIDYYYPDDFRRLARGGGTIDHLNYGDFRHIIKLRLVQLSAKFTDDASDHEDDNWFESRHSSDWLVNVDWGKTIWIGDARERTIATPGLTDIDELMSNHQWRYHDDCNDCLNWIQIAQNIVRVADLHPELQKRHLPFLNANYGPPKALSRRMPFALFDIGYDGTSVATFSEASVINIEYKIANHNKRHHKWQPFCILHRSIPTHLAIQLINDEMNALATGVPAIYNMVDENGNKVVGIGKVYGAINTYTFDKEEADVFMCKRGSSTQNRSDMSLNFGGVGELGKLKVPFDLQPLDSRYCLNPTSYLMIRHQVLDRILRYNSYSLMDKWCREFGFHPSLDCHRLHYDSIGHRIQFNVLIGAVPDIYHCFGGSSGIMGRFINRVWQFLNSAANVALFQRCVSVILHQFFGDSVDEHCSFSSQPYQQNLKKHIGRSFFFGLAGGLILPSVKLFACIRMLHVWWCNAHSASFIQDSFHLIATTRELLEKIEECFSVHHTELTPIEIPKLRCLMIFAYSTLFTHGITSLHNDITLERSHQFVKHLYQKRHNYHDKTNSNLLEYVSIHDSFAALVNGAVYGPRLSNELGAEAVKDLNDLEPVDSLLCCVTTERAGLRVEPLDTAPISDIDGDEWKVVKENWASVAELLAQLRFKPEREFNLHSLRRNEFSVRIIKSCQINDHINSGRIVLKPGSQLIGNEVIFQSQSGLFYYMSIDFAIWIHCNGKDDYKKYDCQYVRENMILLFYGTAYRLTGRHAVAARDLTTNTFNCGFSYHREEDLVKKCFAPDFALVRTCHSIHWCKVRTTHLARPGARMDRIRRDLPGVERECGFTAVVRFPDPFLSGAEEEDEDEKKADADTRDVEVDDSSRIAWECSESTCKIYYLLEPKTGYMANMLQTIRRRKIYANNRLTEFLM